MRRFSFRRRRRAGQWPKHIFVHFACLLVMRVNFKIYARFLEAK